MESAIFRSVLASSTCRQTNYESRYVQATVEGGSNYRWSWIQLAFYNGGSAISSLLDIATNADTTCVVVRIFGSFAIVQSKGILSVRLSDLHGHAGREDVVQRLSRNASWLKG